MDWPGKLFNFEFNKRYFTQKRWHFLGYDTSVIMPDVLTVLSFSNHNLCLILLRVNKNFDVIFRRKFFGNTIAAWFFRGKTHIDSSTRRNLFLTLSCLVTIGYVLIFLLLPAKKIETEEDANRTTKKKALDAFIEAVKLFFKKRTLLLNLVFFYTGVVQSFFGVHNAALSFTMEFGNKAKLLNALAGVFIGIGEILG